VLELKGQGHGVVEVVDHPGDERLLLAPAQRTGSPGWTSGEPVRYQLSNRHRNLKEVETMRAHLLVALAASLLVTGCWERKKNPAEGTDAQVEVVDAGVQDAGLADASALDSGAPDAGPTDAGALEDAGSPDADLAEDGGFDAGAQDAGEVDAGGSDASMLGRVHGRAVNLSQCGVGVIPGARVVASGGHETTTDDFGWFALEGIAPGTVQLTVTRDRDLDRGIAYSTAYLPVSVAQGGTATAIPRVLEGCTGTFETSGEPGYVGCTTSEDYSVRIYVETGAFATAAGATFNGTATIDLFPQLPSGRSSIDVKSLLAAPATARARTREGEDIFLDASAALEIRFYDEAGTPLSIAAEKSVQVTLLSWATSEPEGSLPVFRYDAAQALWVEQQGSAQPGVTEGGSPQFEFSVAASGWYAVGTSSSTTCVRGLAMAGSVPAAGGQVSTLGLDNGAAPAVTIGADGSFCAEMKANGSALLHLNWATGPNAFWALEREQGFLIQPTAAATPSCAEPSSCFDLQTLSLEPVPVYCAGGTLYWYQGVDAPVTNPLPEYALVDIQDSRFPCYYDGAYVGTVTPSSTGAFCAEMPLNFGVSVLGSCQLGLTGAAGTCSAPATTCQPLGDIHFSCDD
jgi:hypothetical protein